MDWVQAIGYQHESVHTGALRHLLEGPQAIGVARALTGDQRISAVIDPRPEAKFRAGSRRSVDLGAELRLACEAAGYLAVELKVDSGWTRTQLVETVSEEVHGVLLAVGYTALAVDDRDMVAIEGYRWPWKRVGPAVFSAIVRELCEGDRELLSYADHLDYEAECHSRALDAVRTGDPVTLGRTPQLLEHWAYFSEIIRHRDDAARWDRKSLISGPLLTLWCVDHDDGTSDYLEFVAHGRGRSLCVKTWDEAGGLLARSRTRLIDLLADLEPSPSRAPSVTAKSCTAARFPVDLMRPADAAALPGTLSARLDRRRG